MRLLQLSDPHLVADPAGFCRGRQPLPRLRHALHVALTQLAREDLLPEQLLLTGDLCQDETWGGYVRLRELLAGPASPGLSVHPVPVWSDPALSP
jgi:Icc protein